MLNFITVDWSINWYEVGLGILLGTLVGAVIGRL